MKENFQEPSPYTPVLYWYFGKQNFILGKNFKKVYFFNNVLFYDLDQKLKHAVDIKVLHDIGPLVCLGMS